MKKIVVLLMLAMLFLAGCGQVAKESGGGSKRSTVVKSKVVDITKLDNEIVIRDMRGWVTDSESWVVQEFNNGQYTGISQYRLVGLADATSAGSVISLYDEAQNLVATTNAEVDGSFNMHSSDSPMSLFWGSNYPDAVDYTIKCFVSAKDPGKPESDLVEITLLMDSDEYWSVL